MQIIAETHSHTIACSHAYSTIYENVQAAARKGLKFLCVTEHAPKMVDGPHEWFFNNLPLTVPDVLDGVIVLKGAEANILGFDGSLDLNERQLKKLDWVIASYHSPCCPPADIASHTAGWLAVAENPDVDVIGHCGDERFRFDYEPVIRAFAEHQKIVEFNAHSFHGRPGSRKNCKQIALLCKKYGVRAVCSSDAHFFTEIGNAGEALDMLMEIGYPEELILNTDYERFLAAAREKSGRQLV